MNKEGHLADTTGYRKPWFWLEMALMFKIVRCPPRLEPFFSSLKEKFHWEHAYYFQTLVVLLAFAWRRHNVAALYRHLDERKHKHRTRFNNFLLVSRWDPAAALRQKAYELLAALQPKPGETIELIFDDTKKQKRGKQMEAVATIFDPVTKCYIRGHQYVKATIRFRGKMIPFAIRLYVKKKDCRSLKLKFQKTTEMVAEIITAFTPSPGVQVRVLFDSFYLCQVVVKACRQKSFRFVSVAKDNRNLFKGGRKLKAGKYGRNLFQRAEIKTVIVPKRRGKTRYEYVDAGWIDVSDLGALHVIFSRNKGDRSGVCLVTDDPKLSGRGISVAYSARFHIEVFFKDAKQLLGLGQYQNGSYQAAVTHLHLVCFAYALLTHIAIQGESEKGKKSKRAVHASTEGYQNELRRIVWADLAQYLKELPDGNSVVRELGRLLIAA